MVCLGFEPGATGWQTQTKAQNPIVANDQTYLRGNLYFPKRKKLNKVMISEPAQKCENYAAILKQNYTLKQFISLKMAFSCCFGSVQNLDFLQKMFYRYGAALNLIRQRLCGTKGPMSMSMQSLITVSREY